jgi:hypothetical protein
MEAEVETTALASTVQSPEAASHMSASRCPLVVLVATNYIQAIVEKIRYTSCVLVVTNKMLLQLTERRA